MEKGRHQVPWRGRFCYDRIGQSNTECVFEAKEQLHTFEAADAQIAVNRVVEARPLRCAPGQFADEAGNNIEHLAVNGGIGSGVRNNHGEVIEFGERR